MGRGELVFFASAQALGIVLVFRCFFFCCYPHPPHPPPFRRFTDRSLFIPIDSLRSFFPSSFFSLLSLGQFCHRWCCCCSGGLKKPFTLFFKWPLCTFSMSHTRRPPRCAPRRHQRPPALRRLLRHAAHILRWRGVVRRSWLVGHPKWQWKKRGTVLRALSSPHELTGGLATPRTTACHFRPW